MDEQETIERTVIGKRIVAVAWLPVLEREGLLDLESLTLEGGTVLKFRPDNHWNRVIAEIEESEHANT
jgi:hypothetical protein